MRMRLWVAGVALLSIAIGLTAALNRAGLDAAHREVAVASYTPALFDLRRILQGALQEGVHVGTVEQILRHGQGSVIKEILRVRTEVSGEALLGVPVRPPLVLASKAGGVIASTPEIAELAALPKSLVTRIAPRESGDQSAELPGYVYTADTYYIWAPILTQNGAHSATLVLGIPAIYTTSPFTPPSAASLATHILIWIVVALALGLVVRLLPVDGILSHGNIGRKASHRLLAVVVLAQIATTIVSLAHLDHQRRYADIDRVERIVRSLNERLSSKAESAKGTTCAATLNTTESEFLELEPAELGPAGVLPRAINHLMCSCNAGDVVCLRGTAGAPELPVYGHSLGRTGSHTLVEGLSATFILSKEWDVRKFSENLIDAGAGLVLAFLIVMELWILMLKFLERQSSGITPSQGPHFSLIRPAAFLFLFGIDISMSFLPLHMERLNTPVLGIPQDIVMGLPISVEFFCVGVSILVGGAWFDRRGWHEPFLAGVFLAGLGVLYSWLAPDALSFIVARGVVGVGYGISIMAAQGFVITHTDMGSKAQGLASLFAGLYSGSICGAAIGSILAEHLSYEIVFLIGGAVVAGVFLYTIVFMRDAFNVHLPSQQAQRTVPAATGRLRNFVLNRIVLGLVFFSSMPASIAAFGFLYYFSPVYLNRIGASESTTGQVLMIYGVCMILIGPFISRFIDSSNNKRMFIFSGCAIGGIAFLVFNQMSGVLAVAVVVFLLGISSSLVLASQSAYALQLRVSRELGEGKALAIFRSSSRLGQMLGPITFGWVIVTTNIEEGMEYLGVAYIATALLFLLLTQRDQKVVAEDGP